MNICPPHIACITRFLKTSLARYGWCSWPWSQSTFWFPYFVRYHLLHTNYHIHNVTMILYNSSMFSKNQEMVLINFVICHSLCLYYTLMGLKYGNKIYSILFYLIRRSRLRSSSLAAVWIWNHEYAIQSKRICTMTFSVITVKGRPIWVIVHYALKSVFKITVKLRG